jgi:hypothetical protein
VAGPFTHWIICEKALEQSDTLGPVLVRMLKKRLRFVLLGAGSPDLPYVSPQKGWANQMHYTTTNGLVIKGYDELRQAGLEQAENQVKFCWLLGYVAHMVADATIHPIVEAIVGDYKNHKEEHRECEMFQDILTYHRNIGLDIVHSEYLEIIKHCRNSPYKSSVLDFWERLLEDAYPDYDDDPAPSLWFSLYTHALDAADGAYVFFELFRHVGIGGSFLYKPSQELKADEPAKCRKYYERPKLPTGGRGDFEQDGLLKAVDNVTEAWSALYSNLNQDFSVASLIKNWDLDTGKDQDAPGNPITYWQRA